MALISSTTYMPHVQPSTSITYKVHMILTILKFPRNYIKKMNVTNLITQKNVHISDLKSSRSHPLSDKELISQHVGCIKSTKYFKLHKFNNYILNWTNTTKQYSSISSVYIHEYPSLDILLHHHQVFASYCKWYCTKQV